MNIRSIHFFLSPSSSPWPGYPNLSRNMVLASEMVPALLLHQEFFMEKLEWSLKFLSDHFSILKRMESCLFVMMPSGIWTLPNPQLTVSMLIFPFLKPRNLFPTTRSSQLAPPSPCYGPSSSLPVSLHIFQVSAKTSLLQKVSPRSL